MAEKHIQAYKDYVKGMKYKDLAEKYRVSVNTIKSWKQRHGWERKKGAPLKKCAHKNRRATRQQKRIRKQRRGSGKKPNAVSHGFFSKYLPEETLSIEEIQGVFN